MQAITTKWAAPGKIRAKAGRGAKTFSVPDNLHNDEDQHVWAAKELGRYFAAQDRKEYGSEDAGANWTGPIVTGGNWDGSYVHVYVEDKGPNVRSVHVEGYRWRDRSGNTYHTAHAYVDGVHAVELGEEYGYGDSYEYRAADAMEAAGLMPGREHYKNGSKEAPFRYWERMGTKYRALPIDVSSRKELK